MKKDEPADKVRFLSDNSNQIILDSKNRRVVIRKL